MDLLLLILVLAIPAIAQIGISRNYSKYGKIKAIKGLTGQEVARKVLDANGLTDIYIVETPGELSDHYDPRRKVVRLSPDIFHGDSIASVSVAAHECGHAIQDKEGYMPMRIRAMIFPIVNVATSVSYFIIFLGILMQLLDMIYLGIALTSLGLLFQIVTLPVEFNASTRAKNELNKLGIVNDKEIAGVNNMLKSAAMTYVAGVLASILQILRLLLVFGNRDE